MSSSIPRAVHLVLGLVATVALTLTSSPPAAASAAASDTAAPATTWQLMDYGQRICTQAGLSRWTYFLIFIAGDRPTPTEVGAVDLPAGTTTTLPHAPIPPGSSDGSVALNLIGMTLPPLPVGVYTAKLTASDGLETQTVPITVRVTASGGC